MAVTRERLDQLYNELFGRTGGADEAGAEYWMASGLTGEALRDELIRGAQGSDVTGFQEAERAANALGARSPERQAAVTKIYNELHNDCVSLAFFTNPRLQWTKGWVPNEDSQWLIYKDSHLEGK